MKNTNNASHSLKINWLDWKNWAWLIGVFTLIELFEKIQLVVSLNEAGYPGSVVSSYLTTELIFRDFLEMYSIALLIPLFWMLARRIHLLSTPWMLSIPANFVLVLGTLGAQQVLFRALYATSNIALFAGPESGFMSYFQSWSLIQALSMGVYFVLLLGVFYGIDSYQRWRERELTAAKLSEQLTAARLEALQMQLQPHFLFNVLQTTSALTTKDPKRAQKMLVKLGDLLRAVLDYKDRSEVKLSEEIQFIESYLEIQAIRFGDRLRIERDFATDALDCEVPTLILQPLVENSVHHGLRTDRGSGVISLGAAIVGQTLRIWVSDNGSGFEPDGNAEGIGLSNTRARLREIYGERAQLILRKEEGQGVRAEISLPAIKEYSNDGGELAFEEYHGTMESARR